jgi:hypothetical protein
MILNHHFIVRLIYALLQPAADMPDLIVMCLLSRLMFSRLHITLYSIEYYYFTNIICIAGVTSSQLISDKNMD